MGRPVTIDDAKLLEAARDVFLSKGATATTEEVAHRAGISQASIFKRFKTKQELFLAAMQIHRQKQDWMGFLQRRTPEVGLRQALVEHGVRVITFLKQVFPLVLVGWSNRGEFGFPKSSGKSEPVRGLGDLVRFLEGEMDQGRLKRLDAWSVVRAYGGALHSFALMSLITPNGVGPTWNATDYVTGVVNVLWEGLAPDSTRVPSPKLAPKKSR